MNLPHILGEEEDIMVCTQPSLRVKETTFAWATGGYQDDSGIACSEFIYDHYRRGVGGRTVGVCPISWEERRPGTGTQSRSETELWALGILGRHEKVYSWESPTV